MPLCVLGHHTLQDLEITRGYVPGFRHVLGHEFVGRVERCGTQPELVGRRVVGEINCNDARFCCADAVFQRNHAPGRSVLVSLRVTGRGMIPIRVQPRPRAQRERVVVCALMPQVDDQKLASPTHKGGGVFTHRIRRCPPSLAHTQGIINKDGCLAEYLTLPAANLHLVPDALTDAEAAFAEPLAAACRILEQGLPVPGSDVAVIGDGKLGLLVAAVLVASASTAAAAAAASTGGDGGGGGSCRVTLLGRHQAKMALVEGLHASVLLPTAAPVAAVAVEASSDATPPQAEVAPPPSDPLSALEGRFPLVVEASGSPHGVLAALRLTRPMGTLLLKSTVSVDSEKGVQWAQVANDIVVNEKILLGSRCEGEAFALVKEGCWPCEGKGREGSGVLCGGLQELLYVFIWFSFRAPLQSPPCCVTTLSPPPGVAPWMWLCG